MDQIVQFFEKLVTEFTWRRLGFILALLFLAIICTTFYEMYTGHFRLGRIERAADLLTQLSEQAEQISESKSDDAKEVHKALLNDLAAYVSPEPVQVSAPDWLWKAGAAAVPWLLLAIVFYFVTEDDFGNLLGGLLIVAIPIAFIGAVLPDFSRSWINYYGYPIGAMILVLVPMFLISNRKKTAS
ncbi:membrane protein [Rhodopirellula maiorica SM1]|uniref:Membrane protein n=1 Tax=Rhodopirellula maiorica SM1 TaxID=1265738 RepID=M5RMH6_9BACT|nr:hypothetical protein [Rhodopirellula maiorica]EMI20528.1 membrane protein [Rhodopirellula maiorica SM1]